MSLATGTRLGPYEVLGFIGAGGMGEVYCARDTRLDRTVAIKVLLPEVSADPDRRARFEREAKTIAGLSHPHICTLFDVGAADDVMFLVMEHLSGESLAERLHKGRLALDQTLSVAAEIADALAAAHRQGIIHRDLKPGNVMLTKAGAKLLDFGLAKLTGHGARPAAAQLASMPTQSAPLTAEGAIVGTLQYMAPEQVEGKPADARTDLWALGAIVYEMLTGRRAFTGESQAAVISAIMSSQPPPPSSIEPVTPLAVDRLVQRSLSKDPDGRWQTATDLADELRWVRTAEPVTVRPAGRGRARALLRSVPILTTLVSVLLLSLVAIAGLWMGRSRAPATTALPPTRLSISLADSGLTLLDGGIAVSPDGHSVVFRARAADGARLYARGLNDWQPRPLDGTEEGSDPFFSPDGQWVAYWDARGGFRKVPLTGGPTQSIWKQPPEERSWTTGAVWASDDTIIFGRWPATGLWTVPAGGGTPRPVHWTTGGGDWCLWPEALPGGKRVLFTQWRAGRMSIAALSLDSGDVHPLPVDSAAGAHYLPSGHLVFESDGRLFGAAFDPETLEMGPPRALVPDIGRTGFGGSWKQSSRGRPFDVSSTGTLAYGSGTTLPSRLVWKDRTGNTAQTSLAPRGYNFPVLSPDGSRVVDTIYDGPARSLWIAHLADEPMARLTNGIDDCFALFSPNGQKVVFTANRDGHYNLYRVAVDGHGEAERLTHSTESQRATSFSRDGRIMLYNGQSPSGGDIWQLKDGVAQPLVQTRFLEREGTFSPDGRWIAYTSNESGHEEVYVQAYPDGTPRTRISMDGGKGPVWNPSDASELFYQAPSAVMAVRVAEGHAMSQPAVVFQHVSEYRDWDVSPDGRRFLVVEPDDPTKAPTLINIVTNWTAELTSLVPARR